MFKHNFGVSGFLAFLLIVLGLSIPALASAAISLDTTTDGTASYSGSSGSTATISLSATTGDYVFLAETLTLGTSAGGYPSAPTLAGQTWTELNESGAGNGWFPNGLIVWYTKLSSSGGTVTWNIPASISGETVYTAVILDAFSGVTSVDSTATHWGKQDPGNAFCDITPSNNNSLIIGFTAYGNYLVNYLPTAGSGFTETSQVGYSFGTNEWDEAIDEYSIGNSSGTQVDVDSSDNDADAVYGEIVAACH